MEERKNSILLNIVDKNIVTGSNLPPRISLW